MSDPITTYTVHLDRMKIQTTSADRAEEYAREYKVTAVMHT